MVNKAMICEAVGHEWEEIAETLDGEPVKVCLRCGKGNAAFQLSELKPVVRAARQVIIHHKVYIGYTSNQDAYEALEALAKFFDDDPRLGLSDETLAIFREINQQNLDSESMD